MIRSVARAVLYYSATSKHGLINFFCIVIKMPAEKVNVRFS